MNAITTADAASRLNIDPSTLHKMRARDPAIDACVEVALPRMTLWNWPALRAAVTPKPAISAGVKLDGVKHGTRTGYNKGCRCKRCRDANAAYMRRYKRK